jgi:hypothetical protein
VGGGDVGGGRRPGLGDVQAPVGVRGGQGTQGRFVERLDAGAAVTVGGRQQQRQGGAGAHDPGQAGHDRRVGGQQATQQRAPREVDGDQVGAAVQLARQRLDGGHDEQGVGQPAAAGRGGRAPRGHRHRRGAGVDADDQPVGTGRRGGEHVAPVAGPKVDGGRRVPGGQVGELADVHLAQAPAHNRPHGSSSFRCRVEL